MFFFFFLKVADLIPSQGTYLDRRYDPCLGTYQRQLIDISLSVSISLPLFLSKNNKKNQ